MKNTNNLKLTTILLASALSFGCGATEPPATPPTSVNNSASTPEVTPAVTPAVPPTVSLETRTLGGEIDLDIAKVKSVGVFRRDIASESTDFPEGLYAMLEGETATAVVQELLNIEVISFTENNMEMIEEWETTYTIALDDDTGYVIIENGNFFCNGELVVSPATAGFLPSIPEETQWEAQSIYPDEATIRVVDTNGNPLPNISVHIEGQMHLSQIYTVSDNNGMAVLQRTRQLLINEKTVTLGLADRNSSDTTQQSMDFTLPLNGVIPVEIVWEKPTLNTEQTNQVVITVVDNNGNPVKDAWVVLESGKPGDPNQINTGMPQSTQDHTFADSAKITDSDGQTYWSTLTMGGDYLATVHTGRSPYEVVATHNPYLQYKKVEVPLINQHFVVAEDGGITLILP